MPRKKPSHFPPWKTAARDGKEKAFVQIGLSQLDHPKILALNHAAFRVYVHMLLQAGKNNRFTYPRGKYDRFISPDGWSRACKELIEAGFIRIAENWSHARKPTVYELIEDWKYSVLGTDSTRPPS